MRHFYTLPPPRRQEILDSIMITNIQAEHPALSPTSKIPLARFYETELPYLFYDSQDILHEPH